MVDKYIVDELADFVVAAESTDLAGSARETLKRNVLDSISCAVGALDGELVATIRTHVAQFGGAPTATLIGGGRASVDQAAFFNAVLVRYPDLLDTYLTEGGLCHPADNLGAVLAVAEHTGGSGADFLLALAVAYEVQCRFSTAVPVMARGINHALQLAMSAAAGSAKLLGCNTDQTANAIAAAAADNVSLAAVHVEPVSNWKGISPASTGMRAVYTTMLAARGVTGPRALFEGPHGLAQLFDQPIDMRVLDRSLTCVEQTYLKKYCSLIHGQVVIDAVLRLRRENGLRSADVARITVEVFQGAYDFAGGGAYGNKDQPRSKEQADYNLKYLAAVAWLDGWVGPHQLETQRIMRSDVQELLERVEIEPAADLTEAYPLRTAARIHLTTRDGREFSCEQSDYEGSPTCPMSWTRVVDKFNWLAEPFCAPGLRDEIVAAVARIDEIAVAELTALLAQVSPTPLGPRRRLGF